MWRTLPPIASNGVLGTFFNLSAGCLFCVEKETFYALNHINIVNTEFECLLQNYIVPL